MFRKISAFVVALIFVSISVSFAFGWGLYSTFTSQDLYDDGFVDLIYDFSIDQMLASSELKEFSTLSPDEFAEILKRVVTKDDLSNLVDDIIEQINDFELDEENRFNLVIPMDWLEEKHQVIFAEFAEDLYQNLPACGLDEDRLAEFSCLDRGLVTEEDFYLDVERVFDRDVFNRIPSEFVFSVELPFETRANLVSLFDALANGYFLLMGLVLLILLVIIALLIFGPATKVVKWEAATISIASFLVSFFMSLLLLIPALLGIFTAMPDSELPVEDLQFFSNIYAHFFGSLAENILIYSVPIFVLSLIIWITFIYRDRNEYGY